MDHHQILRHLVDDQEKAFTPTDFVEQALDEMNTNYIDLLLIHFPQSQTTPTRYNRCGKSLYQSRQQER